LLDAVLVQVHVHWQVVVFLVTDEGVPTAHSPVVGAVEEAAVLAFAVPQEETAGITGQETSDKIFETSVAVAEVGSTAYLKSFHSVNVFKGMK
jgi:hypothetical protein